MAALNIRNTIQKTLENGRNTLRSDYIRKTIERDDYKYLHRNFEFSNDYLNTVSDEVSLEDKDTLLEAFKMYKALCWIDTVQSINSVECYVISINFHSNLYYTVYIPIEESQ